MWMWLTAMAAMTVTVVQTELRLGGSRPGWKLLLGTLTAGAAGSLPFLLWLPAGTIPGALLAGQAAYLIALRLRKEQVMPALGMCLGLGTAFLPLCWTDAESWEYSLSLAVLVLAAVFTLPRRKGLRADFADLERGPYWVLSLLPCGAVLPELAVLSAVLTAEGSFHRWTVVCTAGAYLLIAALVLLLQTQSVRRAALEEQAEAMNRWQSESREYMNTIRAQRHDFNFHLQAMTGLISAGQYEACQEYIQKLNADAADVNDIMPIHDAVVGSMLFNMREEARRRGTDILYNITYDMRDIVCNGFECNKIIGNLLRNAMDALHTPEDLAYGIRLDIFKRRNNTVIAAENRFTGDPDTLARAFEAGYSTKLGHEGIGLAMVQRTARKYGGRIYTEFGENTVRFVVNIPDKVRFQREEGA